MAHSLPQAPPRSSLVSTSNKVLIRPSRFTLHVGRCAEIELSLEEAAAVIPFATVTVLHSSAGQVSLQNALGAVFPPQMKLLTQLLHSPTQSIDN